MCILSLVACLLTGAQGKVRSSKLESITVQDGYVYYYLRGMEKTFTVMFLADTHFTIEDERGREFYDNTRRMGGAAVQPQNYGKSNGRERALLRSLDKAKRNRLLWSYWEATLSTSPRWLL